MATPVTCSSVNDQKARAICIALDLRPTSPAASLDSGYKEARLERHRVFRRLVGANDRQLSTAEVYQKALEVGGVDPVFRPFLLRQVDIPWMTLDTDSESLALEQWISLTLTNIRSEGTKEEEIMGRFFEEATKSIEQGGLGLEFDPVFGNPPRSLGQIYRDRKVTCLDFVIFMKVVANHAGLASQVVPLELYRDKAGSSQEHLRIGLRSFGDVASGKIYRVLDIQSLYDGPPLEGELWDAISMTEFLSYYYNKKALSENDPGHAESFIDTALQMNPGNFLLQYNKAYYCAQRGDFRAARRHLKKSIRMNPDFSEAHRNLAIITHQLRNEPKINLR